LAFANAPDELALVLILTMYGASFFMPVFQLFSTSEPIVGWQALWFVTVAPFDGRAWDDLLTPVSLLVLSLANPVFWLGIFGIVREKGGLVTGAGVMAVIFALSAGCDLSKMKVDWTGYEFGYFVWLGSMMATALYGIYLLVAERRPNFAAPRLSA
jgi:hypothetical protein